MKPKTLLLCCVAALVVRGPVAIADEPSLPDFTDRIVAFTCDKSTGVESKSTTVTLIAPRVVLVGDKYFAHGRMWVPPVVSDNVDEDEKAWMEVYKEVETGVAWNTVISYRAFTPEGMLRYYEERSKQSDDD